METLKDCPDCRKRISKRAWWCTGCGRSFILRKVMSGLFVICLCWLTLLFFFLISFGN